MLRDGHLYLIFKLFRTRRRDAIAAIFAEDPNILSLGRFKRSLQKRLRRSQRRPTLFARFLSNIEYKHG
jgi:hypothetical protein